MTSESQKLTRRSFLGLGTAAAGALAVGSLNNYTTTETPIGSNAEFLPDTWEAETDILVVGCGGAGISAAITAASENLGECLVLEAAPKGFEGGNTRVSAQVLFIPKSVEGAIEYQTNLNKPYVVESDLMRTWAENICENATCLPDLDINIQVTTFMSAEFPELKGSESSANWLIDGMRLGNESLWLELTRVAEEKGVTIQHDTRVTELIFNPITKEVFGVKADVNGATKYYKAKKGVVLACGGFENNPEMMDCYYQIGFVETRPLGTPYNRGDGIKMAQSVGAELWHMNNFAMAGYGICIGKDNPCTAMATFAQKDYIFVGADGKRFMYEETTSLSRHGKMTYGGTSTNFNSPVPAYVVFGQETFDSRSLTDPSTLSFGWNGVIPDQVAGYNNQDYLDAGIIVKADTIEELAQKIGYEPTVLADTVRTYNENAAQNIDPDFQRGTPIYSHFDAAAALQGESTETSEERPSIAQFDLVPLEAPYYAVRLYIQIINTQGGPKRSAKGEVVDVFGKPVPRLYAAGELGVIYAYNYNGGGNVSEAIACGRYAARQIAGLDSWEATN